MSVKNIFYLNLFNQLLARTSNVILGIIILWFLTKEQFASITLFQTVIILIATLSSAGLSNFILSTQGVIKWEEIFILNLALNFVFFLFTLLINQFFNFIEIGWGYYLVASFTLSVNNFSLSYWQKKKYYKVLTTFNIVQLLILIILIFIPKYFILKNVYDYYLNVCIYVYIPILILLFKKKYDILSIDLLRVYKILSSAQWHILYNLVLILGTQLDILILNRYVSKDHLADYALANKLYSIFLIISTTLFNTLLQHVSSLKNVNDQLLFAKRLSKLVFFPVIILYAVFVFIPMDGVSTFLNLQKYESSFSLVKILVIPFFVSIITSSYVAFYFVRDKMESVFKINTFILCLSVPLKIYLSLTFFSLGMTVASAISASLLPLIVSIIVNFKKQNV